ncbi:MAG: VWA domain-containing protein [Planctomycetes bacterium]|nr:VWA domain-containing protein [Planctomycetota bacterium]
MMSRQSDRLAKSPAEITPERRRRVSRRGAIVVLAALVMVIMVALVAFAVDIGYVLKVETDSHRAVDAAALAGAGKLIDGETAARTAAIEYLVRNPIGYQQTIEVGNLQQKITEFMASHGANLQLQYGVWNAAAVGPGGTKGDLVLTNDRPSAIRVSLTHTGHPYFFGRLLGKTAFDVTSEAVATYQPRDIMLVLDFSASMNDDSELKSIGQGGLTKTAIVANQQQIYADLGSPKYGSMVFTPVSISSTNKTTIKNTLGIKNVAYPYANGSWDEYIDYVISSSEQPAAAGYQKKYGYLTLINYWLDKHPSFADTNSLWKTSAQPMATMQDATGVFVDYLKGVDCEDRLGLAVYDYTDGNAKLETGLTTNLDLTADITDARQAGHYHDYTNIAAGMAKARTELVTKARPGAYRMMVLMTDGQANFYNGQVNETAANNAVITEATAAKNAGIKIMTISLGAAADANIMQQVADITGGKHFNVPGGTGGVDQYKNALIQTFRSIADDRPLKIVR